MAKPRNEGLKDKIIELRSNGKTYLEIQKELDCSEGTIYYYLRKMKMTNDSEFLVLNAKKTSEYRKLNPLEIKITNFHGIRNSVTIKHNMNTSISSIIWIKISHFMKGNSMKKKTFTKEELLVKIGDKPKCYLSGRDIDLSKSRTYHLDHILPTSKGGPNTLDNCNIASKEANQSKHDMTLEEYIQLCKDVLENFGYKVDKPDTPSVS